MCGSGTRAGYVMAALEELGYTDVINVGGIGSYTGDNLVAGDGEYMNEVSVLGPYTPGIYFGYDTVGKYNATVVIGQGGGIYSVFFDAAYGDSTKQDLGFDYHMKLYSGGDYEWFEHANMLGDFIVANQGWDGITLDEVAFDDTWNALTVPHHFITIDNDNSPDAISGVSIGAEGFVLAWNAAIAQATDAGTEGVVATTITPTMWAEAHDPAILYVDGEYIVSVDGYSAIITIEGGEIVDVFLDTLYGEDLIADYDNTGALLALGDGEDDTFTPKSTLSIGEYPMNYFMNDNGEWELKLVDEELAIDVAGVVAGNASYSTQVYQEGFAVTNATQYRITFDAYAENARDINVNFGDALTVDPWFTPYMTTSVISLTTTVQTFTIDFTMAEATTADQGKLVFELGAIAGVAVNGMVVIDNVMLEEFDGTDVIAATDQVVNGDFADSDMIGWGVWTGDQWSGVNTSSLPRLLDWWAQADALEAAIIETQQWALDLDDVSGVTISVYNWEDAVKEIFSEAATPITVAEAINTVDGQVVMVVGVITSIMFDGTFTMEDADGTAIYVDDYSANITWGDLTVAVGDEVQVLAIRSDYNGLNLVDDVSNVTVLSTGNAITDAIVVTDMATFRTNATADDYAKRYIFTNVEILETGYYAYFFEPVDGEDRMGIVTSYSDDTIVLTAGDFVTFTATWYGTNGDYTNNTKIFRFSVTQASDYVIVTPAP